MLLEAVSYLTTPCAPYARRMGYLRESIAIEARYNRCRAQWDPHLDATKAVIREAIGRCDRHRKAVVLGSGLLLDIPLKDLSDSFKSVLLVDVVHLRAARRKAAEHWNVSLMEADIAGVAEALHHDAHTLFTPNNKLLVDDPEVDLVVSANLASQLPTVPLAYVDRRIHLDTDTAQDFGRDIIAGHLNHLRAFDAVLCLITDRRRTVIDREGHAVEDMDALYGVMLPVTDAVWHWEIAPMGEIASNRAIHNEVHGFADLRSA